METNVTLLMEKGLQFSSVAQSCLTLQPYGLQHARLPCPSPTPGVHSNFFSSSWWCHPAISSSVVPFSSCPQSLPASGSFPMSQLFAWDGQSIGVLALASVLPMNIQGWLPLLREWQPTPVFLPREFHEQRSLVVNSSWGCKESDITERLTLPFFFQRYLLERQEHVHSCKRCQWQA